MKRIKCVFSLVAMIFIFASISQGEAGEVERLFEYTSGYNDKVFTMEVVPGEYQVKFSASYDFADIERFSSKEGLPLRETAANYNYAVVGFENESPVAPEEYLSSLPGVETVYPMLIDMEGYRKTVDPSLLTVQFKKHLTKIQMREIIENAGSRIVVEQRTYGYYTISVPDGRDLLESIRMFNGLDEVWFAEFAAYSFDDFHYPNDPYYGNQWPHENTGQTGGTPGSDIDSPEGWDLELGDPDVIVVIIDTGADLDHPDLASKILDRGTEDWDFSSGSSKIPQDYSGHGTCTSGIAAAATNNGTGIAGVAPECQIMPLKIDLASGANQNRADAINYVVTQLPSYTQMVISCSWRMSSGDFTAVEAACENARNAGILLCFSTGNDNGPVNYPAKYPTTVGVGASSDCDERKSPSSCDGEWYWGSNYGNEVDVVAPGVHVYTTDISGSGGYSSGSYYPSFNGTSAAAPHAAGGVAMIWSADPSLTADDAQAILEDTAEDQVGPPSEDTPGWDRYMGWGRINLAYAMEAASGGSSEPRIDVQLSNTPYMGQVGSTISWDVRLENLRGEDALFDFWLSITADALPPHLNPYIKIMAQDLTISGYGILEGTLYLTIPPAAPLDFYTVENIAGNYPDDEYGSNSFEVIVFGS